MDRLLHHNLENAAAQSPNGEAFRCGNRCIDYSVLNERASRLAGFLASHGVGEGDLVAVRLPPGIESPLSVYGIMKAGAAFVPVDPLAPDARLSEVLNAGRIRVLIADKISKTTVDSLRATVPSLEVIIGPDDIDTTSFEFANWDSVDQFEPIGFVEIDSDSPAYVIFTSGSTGTPKGIVHSHRSGQAYARKSVDTYNIGPEDRIANLSPLHFDMSTFGYLSSVLAHATTILITPSHAMLPASLSSLMERERVTIWYSVPFALIQLLQRGVLEQRKLDSIRWVMFGGEPFSPRAINQLRRLWPQAKFSNVYGPAEVNQCTYFHVDSRNDSPEDLADNTSVPIGTPWSDTICVVVDSRGHCVPEGESGELLVSTPTMMNRYWDSTEEDTNAFWFAEDSGKRFYRTGDLVRESETGILQFLGRKDRQVKIRGYRLELDEIEHVLADHALVEEAAVVFKDEALVAFAIGDVEERVLRKHMASRLPAYARPSSIEVCSSLPRTSSGKIARRLLVDHSQEGFGESIDESVATMAPKNKVGNGNLENRRLTQ